MKILRIENGTAQFWSVRQQKNLPIDQIDKTELLSLLEFFLENEVEMDQIDADNLQNQAHLIIYRSILDKFEALEQNKSKFKDQSDRLYLDEIREYEVD
ncbi:MAG: hypothetical protein ABJI96_11925 [Paracoccaceae bacterium]